MATIDHALLIVDGDASRAVSENKRLAQSQSLIVDQFGRSTSAAREEAAATNENNNAHRQGAKAHDAHGVSLHSYRMHMRQANREARFWSMEIQNVLGAQKGLAKEVGMFVPLLAGGGGLFMAIEAVRIALELWTEHNKKAEEALVLQSKRAIDSAKALHEERAEWKALGDEVEKFRRKAQGEPIELLPSEAKIKERADKLSAEINSLADQQDALIKPWREAAQKRVVDVQLNFGEGNFADFDKALKEAGDLHLPPEVLKEWEGLQEQLEGAARRLGKATEEALKFRQSLDPKVAAERIDTASVELEAKLKGITDTAATGSRKVYEEFQDWLVKATEKLGVEAASKLGAELWTKVGQAARLSAMAVREANAAAAESIIGPKLEGSLAVWERFGNEVQRIAKEQGADAALAWYDKFKQKVGEVGARADVSVLNGILSKWTTQTPTEKLQFDATIATESLRGMAAEVEAKVRPVIEASIQVKQNEIDNEWLFKQGKTDAEKYGNEFNDSLKRVLADADVRNEMRAMAEEGFAPQDLNKAGEFRAVAEQVVAARNEMYQRLRDLDVVYATDAEATEEEQVSAMEEKERRKAEIVEEYAQKRLLLLKKESSSEKVVMEQAKTLFQGVGQAVGNFVAQSTTYFSRYERGLRAMGSANALTFADMGAQAMKAVADTLTAIAKEATVRAIFETAMGLASLWVNPPAAAGHFAAAATFGIVAGVATPLAMAAQALRPMTNEEKQNLQQQQDAQRQQEQRGTTGGGSSSTEVNVTTPMAEQKVVNLNVQFTGQPMLTKAEVAASLDELMIYLDTWKAK